MKLVHVLFIIITTLSSVVQADFHLGWWVNSGGAAGNYICPSNYFNCQCIQNGDRRATITPSWGNLWDESYFSAKNACEVSKLDFWKRDDGHLDMYISNGDGKVVGQCWRGDAEKECLAGNVFWHSWYWCYSYIGGKWWMIALGSYRVFLKQDRWLQINPLIAFNAGKLESIRSFFSCKILF